MPVYSLCRPPIKIKLCQNRWNGMVKSKPKFLKILIFVESVFCNNFKCELINFTKWMQVNSDFKDIDFASTP